MLKPILSLACACIFLSGCASPPEVEELPADEQEIRRSEESLPAAAEESVPPPHGEPEPVDPIDRLEFTALELRDVRGGELTLELPAPPEAVAEMLLDFENADGHRAWARRHELLSREERELTVRWEMEGKSGVEPVVEMAFRRDTLEDGALRIRFRLRKKDFGLAAFFGDYRISATETGSRVRQRVFIDSGLWIANASIGEIEAGLREDSKLLRAWLAERQREDSLKSTQP